MRSPLPLAILAGALLYSPAGAGTYFATPSTLDATAKQLKAGDTMVLAGTQPFPAWRGLSNRAFNPPITVDAGKATIAGQWYLYNLAGVNFVGGVWQNGLKVDWLNNGAIKPADITVSGGTFAAPQGSTANAIAFSRASRVAVRNVNISGYRYGVVIFRTDGFEVSGSVASALSSDFVQMVQSDNGVIDGNDYTALSYVVGQEHPDAGQGQGWGYSSGKAVTGLRVTNNRARGMAQGFPFLADGCFNDVLIEGNTNEMLMARGLSVACGQNITVRNNVTLTASGATGPSGMFLPANAVRCGNTVASYAYNGRIWPGSVDAPCPVGP
jgi:hypothetical protein